MRTRSKLSAETIDHAASDKKKRKRKDDDSALGDAGNRSKVAIASQSMASQVKSPPKKKRHSCADPERAAEGLFTSENGDDEVFAMTLEKFVGALQKRGAADRSSPKADNEKSTEGAAIEQWSSRHKSLVNRLLTKDSLLVHRDGVQHHEENTSTQQEVIDGQENLTSTHYGEDGLQIVGKDGHHNEPDATLSRGKTEKRSRHKKKGASLGGCLEEAIQNGSHTTLPERRLDEQPLSCPRSGKSKCRPGNIKQFNNQRKESSGSTPKQVSQQPNSCYSHKRLNDAKSRWKNLARSILSAKISPGILASASKDSVEHSESAFVKDHLHRLTDFPDVGKQISSAAKGQNYKTQSLPKKRRKPITAANALAADQRSVTGRMRQKVHKQQLSLLKRMKTWLTEAKFSQSAKEENSNDVGEEFIMTEDERHAFAQSMVKSCQKNSNMRTVFLESVRMLTSSGLMQAAASNLLQQGPCEEAQNVMNAWADFKEQSAITKTLPMNLLNAVNQLHEKRGDLSTKLSTPNVMGICTLSHIDEQTWKFQLPGSPLEDENSLLPSVTKDTAVRKSFV